MARLPRIVIPNQPLHIMHRGNNRQDIFESEEDMIRIKEDIDYALEKSGCQLHAYVVMTNHLHLLITPESKEQLAVFTQAITAQGFKLIKGGRFYHVIGLFDKGQAIDASRDFFAKKYPNKQVVTIGLGDSPNDLPMLETVDIAIVIKSGRSAEMKLNNTRAIFSTKEGPAGWNEEILKLLEAESSET